MPIVVSYEDVAALGSAAIQGGYQPGLAQGQESYRQRQSADSRFMADATLRRWQMERQYQLEGNQREREYGFRADQAALDRGFAAARDERGYAFRGQEGEQNRQTRLQEALLEAQLRAQQDQADHGQAMEMAAFNDELLTGRQRKDDQRALANRQAMDQYEYEAAQKRFADQMGMLGIHPRDARRMFAESFAAQTMMPVARQQKLQGGAGGAQDSPLGTYEGKEFQDGFVGAMNGRFQEPLAAAAALLRPDERGMAQERVMQGMLTAVDHMDPQAIMRNLGSMPPPVQRKAIQRLDQLGMWSTGSNQAPGGTAPPPGRDDPAGIEAELRRRGIDPATLR